LAVVGRESRGAATESGEAVFIASEPAQTHLPAFRVRLRGSSSPGDMIQGKVWPCGSRLAFATFLPGPRRPFPVIVDGSGSSLETFRPCSVLHDAVGLSVVYDRERRSFFLSWWWNAWSPDWTRPMSVEQVEAENPSPLSPEVWANGWDNLESIVAHALSEGGPIPYFGGIPGTPEPAEPDSVAADPEPPESGLEETVSLPSPYRALSLSHACPFPTAPPWLHSVLPRATPGRFDPGRPFWISPDMGAHRVDIYPGSPDAVTVGDSRSGGLFRRPGTPGIRYLRDLVARGVVQYPRPAGVFPSDWDLTGGIHRAGAWIDLFSAEDFHSFRSDAVSGQPTDLPGHGMPLPVDAEGKIVATTADAEMIRRSLSAHAAQASAGFCTRVLVAAEGRLAEIDYSPVPTFLPGRLGAGNGPAWPSGIDPEEWRQATAMILGPPSLVGYWGESRSWRPMVNPVCVGYPAMGLPDVVFLSYDDGFMGPVCCDSVRRTPAGDRSAFGPETLLARASEMLESHFEVGSI
jgi:hypothetical protein